MVFLVLGLLQTTKLAILSLVSKKHGYLTGKLLIAAPNMGDPRFTQTVVFMCAHDHEHAMGIVINQPMHAFEFKTLLRQLQIKPDIDMNVKRPVLSGGPVETERGFVLHSLDYCKDEETLQVSSKIGMTASSDIVRKMVSKEPPKQCLLALGLSGWEAGQIEQELEANAWLICDADDALVFDHNFADKWSRALDKIGVAPTRFSDAVGHA